jgi:hypothetical protein
MNQAVWVVEINPRLPIIPGQFHMFLARRKSECSGCFTRVRVEMWSVSRELLHNSLTERVNVSIPYAGTQTSQQATGMTGICGILHDRNIRRDVDVKDHFAYNRKVRSNVVMVFK